MQIDDLTAGLSLSFLINLNTEQLQFESKILEVYPHRHTLLAQGVFTDDKIISFRGKGLIVDLIVTLPEDKPQLFKNVTTNVVKLSDGTLCYTVSSIAGSKTYNRRQSYRCYIGIETAVQCGLNRAAHDAIIKDISYNGFSVVSREDLKLEVNQTVHAVLNDHMDETAENFNFHLYGLVARIQELENGLFLYGCRLNNPVPGLEQYIIKKERAVLNIRHIQILVQAQICTWLIVHEKKPLSLTGQRFFYLKDYPSIAMYLLVSTAGFASFLGTFKVKIPCLNSPLISS